MRQVEFRDTGLGVKLHICLRTKCPLRTKLTVCVHRRCHDPRSYPLTLPFLAATYYSFMPSAGEERRRTSYIQQALARNLQQAVARPWGLPLELLLMIAGYLTRDCARFTLQEQVRGCDKVADSVLDLKQPIYVSYVKVDGRPYVKSLRNTAGAANDRKGTYLLLPARATREAEGKEDGEDLFMAQDHLGILKVAFVSAKRRDEWCRGHQSVPGVWWRHISWKDLPSRIAIISDVGKPPTHADPS